MPTNPNTTRTRHRKLRRYYGTAEIAEACGVTQQAVSNWHRRGKLPKPNVRLRMGPIWVTEKNPAFRDWITEAIMNRKVSANGNT